MVNNGIKLLIRNDVMLEEFPDVLTPREAMDILYVSRNTFYELVRNGVLPGFKLGPKIWRVKKVDLINYLNEH